MMRTAALVALALLLAAAPGADACICKAAVDDVQVCAGNQDYPNACAATCAGYAAEDITKGDCALCVCAQIYAPVFAGNQPYSNACAAMCGGHTAVENIEGECAPVCTCPAPRARDAVCAGGVTNYESSCVALCDGISSSDLTKGTCRKLKRAAGLGLLRGNV
jgi:hypothetical protein